MTAIDTLCFDDFDPVASATGPTLDGFLLHDLGMEAPGSPVEMGYTRGCRYTWSGGGEPLAIFQGVRSGTDLVLGFFARFDQRFDNNDKIIIALKPAGGAVAQQRRIDINPVHLDLGAGTAAVGALPDLRTNQAPRALQVYKGLSDPADPDARWETCAQPIDVKVRSWRPPSPATDVGWSAEVRIPTTPGIDWITLASGFRLFFSIIRNIDVAGSTFYAGLQFPRDRAKLTGADGTTLNIPDSSYGTGLIGAGLGQGVRFRSDWQGIGRLQTPTAVPTTTSAISPQMSRTYNRLAARIENTSPTDAAPGIVAEFRFGRYGLPPGSSTQQWHDWKQPDGLHPLGLAPKQTAPVTLAPGQFGDLTAEWPLTATETADFTTNTHRCMVATLHSTSDVNFTQASVRANTDFVLASEVAQEAEVSGTGYGPPADGSGEHEFVLLTFARALRGPGLLDAYDIEGGDDPTATITRSLLATVIPPAGGDEAIPIGSGLVTVDPGEFRWSADDMASRTLRFVPKKDGERLRLRVLPSTEFDAFRWEPFDLVQPPGAAAQTEVYPPDPGESGQRSVLRYQVFRPGLREDWTAAESGTVVLTKDGFRAPKPGADWKGVLSSAQVVIWTTFGFLRTGKVLEVDGVKGEVLDETPGEFALVALHDGVDDRLGWSISGPEVDWVAPGVNRLRVPQDGARQIEARLIVGPEAPEGDLGPREVQADPLILEWRGDEEEVKVVTFTRNRRAEDRMVLEVSRAPGLADSDFVWEPLRALLSPGEVVRVAVRPPRQASSGDWMGEIRYRATPEDGSKARHEAGRIRLVKRAGGQPPPRWRWYLRWLPRFQWFRR